MGNIGYSNHCIDTLMNLNEKLLENAAMAMIRETVRTEEEQLAYICLKKRRCIWC